VTPEAEKVVIIDDNTQRAQALADATQLKLACNHSCQFSLQWIKQKLTLRDHQHSTDVTVDFTRGQTLHRLKFGGGHGQAMARAVKTREKPLVCDATAGFGKDAFVFASLECEVVLLEQSVVVHALLQDALKRASDNAETKSIVERMHLYRIDSKHMAQEWPHTEQPQVVYLDPMYPKGKRAAKKEIQSLRSLISNDQSEAELLQAARDTAQRVVVKRPRNALPLADVTPSGEIVSPNTRYDIYGS